MPVLAEIRPDRQPVTLAGRQRAGRCSAHGSLAPGGTAGPMIAIRSSAREADQLFRAVRVRRDAGPEGPAGSERPAGHQHAREQLILIFPICGYDPCITSRLCGGIARENLGETVVSCMSRLLHRRWTAESRSRPLWQRPSPESPALPIRGGNFRRRRAKCRGRLYRPREASGAKVNTACDGFYRSQEFARIEWLIFHDYGRFARYMRPWLVFVMQRTAAGAGPRVLSQAEAAGQV